jgi:arsenite methyltransferase
MTTDTNADSLREVVRNKYAERARQVTSGGRASCCGTDNESPITANLYSLQESAELPEQAVQASLGCGNPTALASLRPGEVVLDLGSGGGIDVLLSARRVGPTGFAYGLDMTDEMLDLARRNAVQQGANNVEFLKGQIEQIPLPENTVDVIISNCVINLSADKARVIGEAFRVLKPGGRFAVSDVVVQGELPSDLRTNLEAWVGCIAGALEEQEYRRLLAAAGFEAVEVEVTRVYDPRELAERSDDGEGESRWQASAYARFEASGGRLVSAFIRATKPSARANAEACCAPSCCSSEAQ